MTPSLASFSLIYLIYSLLSTFFVLNLFFILSFSYSNTYTH